MRRTLLSLVLGASALIAAVAPAAAAPGPPDLSVGLTATPNPVVGGNTLTYTLQVANTAVENCRPGYPEPLCSYAGRTATGVRVQLLFPVGPSYVSSTADHGFVCYGYTTSVECRSGTLAMDDLATLTIRLRTQPYAGSIAATAIVDPLNSIAERSESNNTSSVTTTVTAPGSPPPPLLLSAHVSGPTSPRVGQAASYTVTLNNNSVPAANVESWLESGLGFAVQAVHAGSFSCSQPGSPVIVDCGGGTMGPVTELTYSVDVVFTAAGCAGLSVVLDPNNALPQPKTLSSTPLQVCAS